MSITSLDLLRDRLHLDGSAFSAKRWYGLLVLALNVRRERDQLARLTPEQLADIGVHPAHAAREAARDLFDLPQGRAKRI